MTVCISAIADGHEAIVSCVDTRTSTSETSLDTPVGSKMRGYADWIVLTSGTTCYAERFFNTFRNLIAKEDSNEPETVKAQLEKTRRIELERFCGDRYLSPFGLTMQEYLQSNSLRDKLPDEIGRGILDYSEQYDVELIVSGWGKIAQEGILQPGQVARARIFSASRNGVIPHTNDGFYVSGSGSPSAYSMLAYFHYDDHMPIARAIYYVAAAKFMSERAAGVGPNTNIRVSRRRGGDYIIQPQEIKDIRQLWESTGAPRLTHETEDALVAIVVKTSK